MTDWKAEHDAELGLRREWSARAQKAEAEVERLRAALQKIVELWGGADLIDAQRIAHRTIVGPAGDGS